MKWTVQCSFGIHTNSIRLFRIGLALLAIFEGIKLGTIHSLMFVSEHRLFEMQWKLYDADRSNINLFQISESEFWPTLIIFAYIILGTQLLRYATEQNQVVSWALFFLKNSINTQACHCCSTGDRFLPALFLMSACFPSDDRDSRGKWHHTSATAAYYVMIIYVYTTAGLHKVFDQDWRSGNAMQLIFFKSYANDLGLYVGINYPAICRLLTRCTFILELLVPFLLISRRTRFVATVSLLALHIGIALTLEIEQFPYISMCSLFPFLPPFKDYRAQDATDEAVSLPLERRNAAIDLDSRGTKKKKRSKTPQRKRRTSASETVERSAPQSESDSNSNHANKSWVLSALPAFYTFLFILSAWNNLYVTKISHFLSSEVKQQLPGETLFSSNAKRLANFFDITCGWGVFTYGPAEPEGMKWITWFNLPAKICARRLKRTNTPKEPEENDAAELNCRWVDLKHGLGSIALSESIFPSALHVLFRSLWLPAHDYISIVSGINAVPSSTWVRPSEFSREVPLPRGMVLPEPNFELMGSRSRTNGYASTTWYTFISGWGYKEKYGAKLARYLCKRINNVSSFANGSEYALTVPTMKLVKQWKRIKYDKDSIPFIPPGCNDVHGYVAWEWSCSADYGEYSHPKFHNKCYSSKIHKTKERSKPTDSEIARGENYAETGQQTSTSFYPTEKLTFDSEGSGDDGNMHERSPIHDFIVELDSESEDEDEDEDEEIDIGENPERDSTNVDLLNWMSDSLYDNLLQYKPAFHRVKTYIKRTRRVVKQNGV
jgi:hypothetical protein